MTRRLALLRMLGLLPATRYGSMGQMHRRPDQQTDAPSSAVAPTQAAGVLRARLVIIFGSGANTGLFVYSGTPAKGHLVAAITAPGVTADPYGNAIPTSGVFNAGTWNASGVLTSHFGVNNAGDTFLANTAGLTVIHEASADGSIRFYNTSGEGAGNLVASQAPAAGTDAAGNHYIAGYAVYNNATGVAAQLFSNGLFIYTGSLAAGWTIGSAALNSSGNNWVLAANSVVTINGPPVDVLGIATPAAPQAGNARLFADTNGFFSMLSGLAGDTAAHQIGEVELTNGGFTINLASPQTIFSCPVGIGTYLVEVWLVSSNTTPADAAGWAFQGPTAGTQLVAFESKAGGVLGYAASSTYTTTFNGQGTGGNQDMMMRGLIAFTAAGNLIFTGKELVLGNTIAVFGGWMRVRHVS